jgi:hypothetical protein
MRVGGPGVERRGVVAVGGLVAVVLAGAPGQRRPRLRRQLDLAAGSCVAGPGLEGRVAVVAIDPVLEGEAVKAPPVGVGEEIGQPGRQSPVAELPARAAADNPALGELGEADVDIDGAGGGAVARRGVKDVGELVAVKRRPEHGADPGAAASSSGSSSSSRVASHWPTGRAESASSAAVAT